MFSKLGISFGKQEDSDLEASDFDLTGDGDAESVSDLNPLDVNNLIGLIFGSGSSVSVGADGGSVDDLTEQ
jgi:hypothetical protein